MSPKRASSYGIFAALGLTTIYFCMCRFTLGIGPTDDFWYMEDAVTFQWRRMVTEHYWSPLYGAWLHSIAFLVPDGLWDFFVSWALLLLVLTVLPGLFRLRYSWIYAVVLVCGPLFAVRPFLWIFSAVFVTLGACIVLRKQRTVAEAMFAACVTSFVLSFARSEFDMIVWVTGAACLVALLTDLRRPVTNEAGNKSARGWNRWLMVGSILLLCASMVYIKKMARGERSGMAFAQHFNIRASQRGLAASWNSDYAERAFGVDTTHNAMTSTASLGDYFRANPRLFLGHVAANLLDPKTCIFILFAVGVLVWPWLRKDEQGLRPASLFVACMVSPALIEIALIYPRDHYALMVFPALLLLLLQAMPARKVPEPPLLLLFATGAILMVSVTVVLPRLLKNYTFRNEHRALLQIECMRAADVSSTSNSAIFEPWNISDVLFARKHTHVDRSTLPSWNGFLGWATTNHPAWIAVDESFPLEYTVQPAVVDTSLRGQLGYVAHACPAKAAMTIYSPKLQ